MTRITLLLVALAVAFPATAAAKDCPTKSVYTAIETTDVGCKQAKKIVNRFFRERDDLFGFTCSQKQYPGGVTTTCSKGDRRVVHMSAD